VIRPGEIDHLERECLSAVVACVSEGDWHSDPPEGDNPLARDHSVEWMWAALELVTGKSWPFEGVEVHEVETTRNTHFLQE
jgi:hypothetical protein